MTQLSGVRQATGPAKHVEGQVTFRREISDELWVIRVATETPLSYMPGQYATLAVPGADGKLIERPYSMSSSPTDGELEFFLERVSEGELTPRLYDVGVGDTMLVRPRTKGLFLKGAAAYASTRLLVGTVTGVAPFVSLVRYLSSHTERDELSFSPTLLLQGASEVVELGYEDELTKASATLDWLTFVPTISRPWSSPEWTGEMGRVEDVVRKWADPMSHEDTEANVFLCGHPQMVVNVRTMMKRSGCEDSLVHEEQYWRED